MLSACAAGDAPRQASCEEAGGLPQCFAAKDRDLGQRVLRCGEHAPKSRLEQNYDSNGPAPLVHLDADRFGDDRGVTGAATDLACMSAPTAAMCFAQLPMPPPMA